MLVLMLCPKLVEDTKMLVLMLCLKLVEDTKDEVGLERTKMFRELIRL